VTAPLKFFRLCSDVAGFGDGPDRSAPGVPGADLLETAYAVAANPQLADVPDATVLLRQGTRPLLGVVGRFTVADESRLAALQQQLSEPLPRHISYQEAEEDCEELAERLVREFGKEDLQGFRFTAIPRGGFIVLGMLAYRLGLRRSQLNPDHPAGTPVVVVDDCSITGFRFGEWLRGAEDPRVIFAHLYSHPDLRAAVERREERVLACLSARDLTDNAPDRLGPRCKTWRTARLRQSHHRYWVGQIDRIAFAWSEPAQAFWNAATRRMERSWSLIPPRLHLRNRRGVGISSVPVQVQEEAEGARRPACNFLFGEVAGDIIVGDVDTPRSFTLSGVAADMWRTLLQYSSLEDALGALLHDYEVDAERLRFDLTHFVREMETRRVLKARSDDIRLVG